MESDRDVLSTNVKPAHYSLSLTDLDLGAPWGYQGNLRIDVAIRESTQEIVLNAHQLKIHEAIASAREQSAIKANHISYDETSQRATLTFPSSIPASPLVFLDIKFEGVINNVMAGFYRSKYKPAVTPVSSVPKDEEHHYMFSTQFESCDARRAFPCFDEPNLKATFDFEIEIPEDQTAISNMPEKGTKPSSKAGRKIVSFDRSPIMSTYLLAWAVGDFEYVEAHTARKYRGETVPVRVYTTRGLKEQGRYALEHAPKVIDYFSEIFGIDYPLPKSDLLAVHEFTHGAMENWGLVTYRTTAVLFDEANSDQRYRNRVAYVVAHELAHQWFGNLVTMNWWNELWLNEGFATWVGMLAVDHLHPDWDSWAQFVGDTMDVALDFDALRSSHPIEVPVRNALEVDQIFDAISYRKGSSVIRMLSAHLGQATFLKGVSDYLKSHSYANATTNDLWDALKNASGSDVAAFIDPWIRKIGYPVLTVAEEPGQIGVKQGRFLVSGDVKRDEDETIWWLPLGISSGTEGLKAPVSQQALSTRQETIRNVDEGFYKINTDQTGFYRTNYPPPRLIKLGQAKDRLSVQDRIGLISDASALAFAGEGTTPALLSLLEAFNTENNCLVWMQILGSLASLRSIFTSDTLTPALRAFTLRLISPTTEKLGWEFPAGEDYLTSRLRSSLISAAGLVGHQGIIKEACQRFNAFMAGDQRAIHQNLRGPVFYIAVTSLGRPAYDRVREWYLSTTAVDGKEQSLAALGRVQDPALAAEYFDFTMSDAVKIQDAHTGPAAMAANVAVRDKLWECIQKDWKDVIVPRIGGNSVILERFVRLTLSKFASRERHAEIEAFFKDKDIRGFDRAVAFALDTVDGRTRYRERDASVLEEWLRTRGYT